MKTVQYQQYGSPDVLKLVEADKPVPLDNEVLIKVHATTVTVADSRARSLDVPASFKIPARLMLGFSKPKQPVLGMELAGEVEAVGKDVTRFNVGDAVFAATLVTFGGYAQYKCLPEDSAIALKPSNLTYEEAATIPIGARTALHYLKKANIQPGQKVLVYGASGSVGTYGVQLAKYFGAEVTAVCSTRNVELVKSLGADKVIDYKKENFAQQGEQYDVVFEAVDKSSFADCMRVLKDGGFYLNMSPPFPTLQMLWTRLTTKKTIALGENSPESAETLTYLKGLVETGDLKPVIDKSYPLTEIVEAHRYVDTGRKRGNVVITVAHD